MNEQGLELVFYGELELGADLANTKTQMAQLFKASESQIDRMFSGQRVVLKSKLDQATADKYLGALKARGASCKIEEIGGAITEPASTPEPAPSSISSTSTSTSTSTSEESTAQPNAQQTSTTPQTSPQKPSSQASPEGALPVAGDKVDEVLANSHLVVEPAGVDLGEKHEDAPAPELSMQDSLSIAPAGSDLGEKKEEKEAIVPDISHLKLDE